MQHKYIEHKPMCDDALTNCPICSWGALICTVCKAAEGELTTECPGIVVPPTARDLVMEKKLDFVGGRWVNK